MNATFINNCNHKVTITMTGSPSIAIQPHQSACLTNIRNGQITFSLKCDDGSYVKRGNYFLSIDTVYYCDHILDGDNFMITLERIRVDINVYFERLFVYAQHSACVPKSFGVWDEKEIKKTFNRNRLLRFLFIDPIEYLPGLVIALLVLGVILLYVFGWKFAAIYVPIAYLLLLAIGWFTDRICNWIFKKGFKINDTKTEFYGFFKGDFIERYYSDIHREPFMGGIETD